MKRLCVIGARGGSKGVKNKNIRDMLGEPLISYTIKQAQRSELFDEVAVSSDSDAILAVAEKYGITALIKRPDEMATDTAGKLEAIRHCLLEVEKTKPFKYEMIVDLDATSPLRLIEDIRGAVKLAEETGVSNVITGCPAHRSPYFNLVEVKPDGHVDLAKRPEKVLLRRQDAPECFDMNASIYVWTRAGLFDFPNLWHPDTRIFVMPEERSRDIDSELDFAIVEFLATKFGRFKDQW